MSHLAQGRKMQEYITRPIGGCHEPVSLNRIKPLDGAGYFQNLWFRTFQAKPPNLHFT
jgi:hypothetical protein